MNSLKILKAILYNEAVLMKKIILRNNSDSLLQRRKKNTRIQLKAYQGHSQNKCFNVYDIYLEIL